MLERSGCWEGAASGEEAPGGMVDGDTVIVVVEPEVAAKEGRGEGIGDGQAGRM